MNRIEVQTNDLPSDLYVHQIPTLLFQPANSQLFSKNKADSILFEYKNDLSLSNLLNFVLSNSRNPNTIIDFLKSNSHQLKNDLNEILTKKISILESKTYFLNRKVHYIFNESSRIDMKESIINSDDETSHQTELLQIQNTNNNNNDLMNYKRIYLNEINSILNNKLNNYLIQISHLKNMKDYFKN